VARDYNFWVYIMTNKHHTVLYIGMTDDLARRVSEHRTGEIPGFTASYRCKKLVYYEYCTDVLAVITREKQLKRWSRSKKVALIATMNSHWRDLAPEVLGEEQQPALIRSSPA
jgi:putative endonuclease